MRRYDPDAYAQDWTGRYARAPGASVLYAHTIRRRDKHGWRTWCGMRAGILLMHGMSVLTVESPAVPASVLIPPVSGTALHHEE